MARYKHPSRKKRLAKLESKPDGLFWTVPKIYGKSRKVHPDVTLKRRSWRRTKTKA